MSLVLLGILNQQLAGGDAGAPSFDLLETVVLDAPTSAVDFINLTANYAGDYQHLQIRGLIRETGSGTTAQNWKMEFNGDGGSSYASHRLDADGGSLLSFVTAAADRIQIFDNMPESSYDAGAFGAFIMDILDFSSTSKNKTIRCINGTASATNENAIHLTSGVRLNLEALNELNILTFADSFAIGSRFSLYGIKAA